MSLANIVSRWLLGIALWVIAMVNASATPGQLPLGYRISAGAYPWTGQLHALAFRTAALSAPAVLTQWSAGEQLDRQDIHARRLYLGGDRLEPLRWDAIDNDARAELDDVEPTGLGQARLAWLHGDLRDRTLRPRDTRLGNATGARVHVVPPPAWQPMQPGHADFRQRHVRRSTTVWLGTRDGLLHGFDAVGGQERVAYLPRAMLRAAASLTASAGTVPAAPCPRPLSVDADPSGTWRTLLLCGIPARDTPTFRQTGAVFALDITTPDEATPIGLLWEVSASNALRLSGSGPIDAAMWIERGVRRWAAVAIVSPDPASGQRASLVLLPLDRPPESWAASTPVQRIQLPESGCDAPTTTTQLMAATVGRAASGVARAAYATDREGRLWRFALDHLSTGAIATPATCMHRQRRVSGESAEAPVVVQTGHGSLVVFGTGNELSAIPDRARPLGTPVRIESLPKGDGVVLRMERGEADAAANGWTLTLPHTGERIERLYSASPAHLGFTTVDAQGRQRSYLVDAARGESAIESDANGTPTHAITGLPWEGSTGTPVRVTSTIASGGPTTPGTLLRDTFELGLWDVQGDTAKPLQQVRWQQRRGRLGWRELVRSPQ